MDNKHSLGSSVEPLFKVVRNLKGVAQHAVKSPESANFHLQMANFAADSILSESVFQFVKAYLKACDDEVVAHNTAATDAKKKAALRRLAKEAEIGFNAALAYHEALRLSHQVHNPTNYR